MNTLSWNCRGAGGPRKRQFLNKILWATRASIAFVSETKCSQRKSNRVLPALALPNHCCVGARGRSGGLWLLWSDSISLQVVSKSRSLIHARISDPVKPTWSLLCVYGDPAHANNSYIWEQITAVVQKEPLVCVIGDFNAIADVSEKWGGDPAMNTNNRHFRDFLFKAGLVDLGFKGPAFTWTNKQHASSAIFERLDRAVASAQWNQLFPHAYVNHMPRVHSDHAAILLRTNNKPLPKKNFKIENWWFNTPGFTEAWEGSWKGTCSMPWQNRIGEMTRHMHTWAKNQPTPQNRMNYIQHCLYHHQLQHPSMQDPRTEDWLVGEFHQAERDLEDYWRQRSRIQWHCEGDRNTTFFHTIATSRRRKNMITQIHTDSGSVVTDESAIRREFVSYFKSLYCPIQPHEPSQQEEFFHTFDGLLIPQIPLHSHSSLQKPPCMEEVRNTLFQMGPDKAPGPDGVTAGFLQRHWSLFSTDLTHAIGEVFLSQKAPVNWLHSQIVLIPKTDEPKTPRDYRPITIGNIIYRLLMKIIANRLQPYMAELISNNQTAFIRGRNIADNTVLVREILHSFQSKSYTEQSFLLKADITKAFDTVRWSFVMQAMKLVQFPPKLILLIKSCLNQSRVTILVNGSGQGFITPNRGLRQGCPLSPYLFILAMEILTKQFYQKVQSRVIKGIKLARSAPAITHILYADDLMVMGQATAHEIREYKQIFEVFEQQSGLVLHPEKSTIWYSESCNEESRSLVQREFNATLAEEKEKYLGVIVTAQRMQNDLTHDLLVEKLYSRLAGWKIGMLSIAGRVALIKSVLLSIPVYYMSVSVLPANTIKKINSVLRRFLWGKTGTERYMSFISWKKVCESIENGGLGIRDVKSFNQALILKMVWQLASNSDKLWVQIFKAKYFSKGGFWAVKGKRDASPLWRAIQDLKHFFNNNIRWHVGQGTKIKAVNEPWFPGYHTQRVTTNLQKDTTVADIFDEQRDEWRTELITNLLGTQAMHNIRAADRKPHRNAILSDRLIWTESKTGNYSTKEGYAILVQQHNIPIVVCEFKVTAWRRIWALKTIIPRVKAFLWRAVHGGLAIASEMHKRINSISATCPRCGKENEFLVHVLFSCELSRATWYISVFALRSDFLPLDFTRAFLAITDTLTNTEMGGFCNILWCLWKGRNEEIFQGKKSTPQSILIKAKYMEPPSASDRIEIRARHVREPVLVPAGTQILLIDASWASGGEAGWGAIFYDETGCLKEIAFDFMTLSDPFHAEAMVLLQVLQQGRERVRRGHRNRVMVFSDCKVLVNAVHNKITQSLPSWEAAQTVAECINLVQELRETVSLTYITREALKGPHKLANWARVNSQRGAGPSITAITVQLQIPHQIDAGFFKL